VQRQSHEAVAELIRALARERPVCLVLEDLHFADEPTLELFQELLQLADEKPVALLLAYRHDPDLRSWELGEAARRRHRHRFRELLLEPLDASDAARLATAAAGRELPDDVAAQLAERTGGNPLFLEEAARDAVERGDGAAVPAAIQEALQARLDRLAPDVRDVASVASVVGRSFGLPLLERLVPSERLRPALSELQRLDLVVEERRRPAPEYRFRHGLVREAAYTSLLDQRRRDLHRVVGTTLEELGQDELSEAYGLLAHHFAEADEPERAARYLLEAGDAARAVYAEEEATANYRRALSFLERLGDAGRSREALFKIALTHHLAFDFQAADAAWAEAFTHPRPQPTTRLAPTERLETASLGPQSWAPGRWAPGHSYDTIAWAYAPNLFRGLLRLERGLDVVPDLAERVAVSADGCTYLFQLREDLHWSDGEPLGAADFAETYAAMLEQDVPTAHLLYNVDARAVDELTLELRLPEPQAHIPYLFAQLPFFPWPRHKLEELGAEWHAEAKLVGNGPFALAEANEERTVFTRNPHWPSSTSNVAELTINVRDPFGSRDEWQAGRLDFVFVHSLKLEDFPDGAILHKPELSTDYIGFPDHAPFDDVRVRRALAHGLDRAPLIRGTVNTPAHGGFLPPPMPGHSHDLAPAYDLDRARALLAEAGYPHGRGLPELRLLQADFGAGPDFRRDEKARWESQWRELGVRVRQEWVDFDALWAEVGVGPSFWVYGWASDYPDPESMLGTFVESNPIPPDSELSRLLEQARSLRARDERLDLYREADRRLVAESVRVVPTIYGGGFLIHRPHVEGMWTHPLGIGSLDEVVVHRP
jgi:ABC-type transport system substrate-binding protein